MDQALAEKIKQIFCAAPVPIDLVYVFGSVAAGGAKANSDIDIAVLGRRLTTSQKMALWQQVADVANRPVDWIDLSNAGTAIIQQAMRGERIVGSVEKHAQLLARMLVDSEDFGILYARLLKERRDAWLNSETRGSQSE